MSYKETSLKKHKSAIDLLGKNVNVFSQKMITPSDKSSVQVARIRNQTLMSLAQTVLLMERRQRRYFEALHKSNEEIKEFLKQENSTRELIANETIQNQQHRLEEAIIQNNELTRQIKKMSSMIKDLHENLSYETSQNEQIHKKMAEEKVCFEKAKHEWKIEHDKLTKRRQDKKLCRIL